MSNQRPDRPADACAPACRLCNRCAHIIGVSVNAMMPDMTMATLTVTANSRNRRPMMPPMNSSGMNTAISENVIDTMVKPLSRAPRSAASIGGTPLSTCRAMFSTIVDDEADRDGQRHQGKIVEAVAEEIHDGERRHQ